MFKLLSPTLVALALGLGTSGMLMGATVMERDQQALIIKQLISQGFRLPADHQLAEFKAAGYQDDGLWIERALREMYLGRFLTDISPPSGPDPALQTELKNLTNDLDAQVKAKTLPPIAASLRSGGGGILRLVQELARYIYPDSPPSQVEPSKEKKSNASLQAAVLFDAMVDSFKKNLDIINTNKDEEKALWDKDEHAPETKKLFDQAYQLRHDALRDLYYATLVLREVATRGDQFWIPEAKAKTEASLRQFFTDNLKELTDWDNDFGTTVYDPSENHYYSYVLFSIAQQLGVKNLRDDDIDEELEKYVELDPMHQHDTASRNYIMALRLRCLGSILRWRLAQGTPEAINKGIATWNGFLTANKENQQLKLVNGQGKPPNIAEELGRVYILAGRLFMAHGDATAATVLLEQVKGAHPSNPLSRNASDWVISLNNDPHNHSKWSDQPVAIDPASALSVAGALLREADGSIESSAQRDYYLKAAITLRNGALGLTPTDEKTFIESGPALYQLYAHIFYKMGMLQQSAIIGMQGSAQFANYLDARLKEKKTNPWFKPGTKEYDKGHSSPRTLVLNSFTYANNLLAIDPNMEGISEAVIKLLERISPGDSSSTIEKEALWILLQSGQNDAAIAKAQDFAKKYPKEELWAFQFICTARTYLLEKLIKDNNTAAVASLQQDINKDTEAMEKRLTSDPDHSPEHLKEIADVKSAIRVTKFGALIATKKFAEAIDGINTELASAAPSDMHQVATKLNQGAKAAFENDLVQPAASAKNFAAVKDWWKRTSELYRHFQKFLPKIKAEGSDMDSLLRSSRSRLAQLFGTYSGVFVRFQSEGDTSPELTADIDLANRAFADLYEPLIDDRTKPANVLFCANKLWDVGEKERAAALYERYLGILAKDTELQAFKKEGKPVIDKYTAVVETRVEFTAPWEEIVDLAWDSPEWLQAYNNRVSPMPPGEHADYFKCLAKFTAFRANNVAKTKFLLSPEQNKTLDEALNGFERLIDACAHDVVVSKHLAQYYRESGQADKALPLLMQRYTFDTRDPDAQIAIVDLTRAKLAKGDATKDEIDKAMDLIGEIGDTYDRLHNKIGKHEADLLFMEFMFARGDAKKVNDTLKFEIVNKSDLSYDLRSPPVDGDDPAIRRAMNAQAVGLAKRYLELFTKTGITASPPFRIDEIDAGTKTITIFTAVDSPKFIAKSIKTPDDEDVTVIVRAGAADKAPAPGDDNVPK